MPGIRCRFDKTDTATEFCARRQFLIPRSPGNNRLVRHCQWRPAYRVVAHVRRLFGRFRRYLRDMFDFRGRERPKRCHDRGGEIFGEIPVLEPRADRYTHRLAVRHCYITREPPTTTTRREHLHSLGTALRFSFGRTKRHIRERPTPNRRLHDTLFTNREDQRTELVRRRNQFPRTPIRKHQRSTFPLRSKHLVRTIEFLRFKSPFCNLDITDRDNTIMISRTRNQTGTMLFHFHIFFADPHQSIRLGHPHAMRTFTQSIRTRIIFKPIQHRHGFHLIRIDRRFKPYTRR